MSDSPAPATEKGFIAKWIAAVRSAIWPQPRNNKIPVRDIDRFAPLQTPADSTANALLAPSMDVVPGRDAVTRAMPVEVSAVPNETLITQSEVTANPTSERERRQAEWELRQSDWRQKQSAFLSGLEARREALEVSLNERLRRLENFKEKQSSATSTVQRERLGEWMEVEEKRIADTRLKIKQLEAKAVQTRGRLN